MTHRVSALHRSFRIVFLGFLLIGTGLIGLLIPLDSLAASTTTEKNHLFSLKQAKTNFTTIQNKVLYNFKDNSLALRQSEEIRGTRYTWDQRLPQRIGPMLTETPQTQPPLPEVPRLSTQTLERQNFEHLVGMETAATTTDITPVEVPVESAVASPQDTELATDSNPDELYNFDGSKETLSGRRSVRTQSALAEYYNDRMRELSNLEDKVNLMLGQQTANPAQTQRLNHALQASRDARSKFETFWFQQNFGKALEAYETSKDTMMRVVFADLPVESVEGRAIWLDRGTIVKAGSPDNLRQIIRRIAASGFNVIYFETINAGFPIYPSAMVEQNPQIKGWDPLAVAVEESHKHGVELHAWVWVFAVGNTRHNKILGQPASYPGPILSKPELASEALKGPGGRLVLPEQYEYWLSPASYKARAFLTSLYSEIVRKYDVDGLQLDYIRYPFQKPGLPMGLEYDSAQRFTSETGLNLASADEYTMKAWSAWKAFQVTTFVHDVSQTLKGIKPNLKLSAAVFPMARYGRMMMIQQDWESWVRNGWIDTLSPMAYSKSPRSLERLVNYIHSLGDNKTLVYPGLSLIKLNAIELLNVLEVCRQNGVMGTTLFAMAQFDGDKQLILQKGPYKERQSLPPHRAPLQASQKLVGDTLKAVHGLMSQSLPVPALKEIEQSLNALNEDMHYLSGNTTRSAMHGYRLSGLRDNSKLLAQQAEQWLRNSEDPIARFQAQMLNQLVSKVVRMVNFASYQLDSPKTQVTEKVSTGASN